LYNDRVNKLTLSNGGNGTGFIRWRNFPIDEFDDAWARKYAIRAERMAQRFKRNVRPEVVYNHIYRLHEFLWKLKVWKP
jgi:hypothetical protein